jgi:hypothetical protein
MTDDPVRRLADAVLYEGYLLWPYRRSALKNQRRWTFGAVLPGAYVAEHRDERARVRAEVLLEGDAAVEVRVRFLQLVWRQVLRDGRPVDAAEAGGRRWLTWQEAVERECRPGPIDVPAGDATEQAGDGVAIARRWQGLRGRVDIAEQRLGPGLRRVRVVVENATPLEGGTREAALERGLCSMHAVLRAPGGAFASSADPPARLAAAARGCVNDGLWPALVGEPGRPADTVLAAPIILEDHPRIAPESPGDLFDGGEIDELLVLSILGLTDDERAEMRDSDPRARAILERTEGLTAAELRRLHGAWR